MKSLTLPWSRIQDRKKWYLFGQIVSKLLMQVVCQLFDQCYSECKVHLCCNPETVWKKKARDCQIQFKKKVVGIELIRHIWCHFSLNNEFSPPTHVCWHVFKLFTFLLFFSFQLSIMYYCIKVIFSSQISGNKG